MIHAVGDTDILEREGATMARLPRGMSEYKGRIRYQFTEAGKRYSVYGQTVKECREKELEKRKEIEQGLNSRGKNQTMNDFYDK